MGDAVVFTGMRVREWRVGCVVAVLVVSGLWRTSTVHLTANEPTALDSFESAVRPLLTEHCLRCHSDKKQEGGLRLDSRDALLWGGDSGPALDSEELDASRFLTAILYADENLQMPPKGKLPESSIAILKRWILSGAPFSSAVNDEPRRTFSAEDRDYWAFRPVVEVEPPELSDHEWVRSPIDAFVLSKLKAQALEPSPLADKRMLIRRLYFDLLGLPPSPEAVRAFLEEASPQAYEKVVDRLLASPRYGERWGRHWLDLVRYADSDGFRADHIRPHAWRYRDYVVSAFNVDLPYDRFVTEQIAGDELLEWREDAVIATGYLCQAPYEYNQVDVPQQLTAIADDVTEVTAEVFLALGMKCARCHDHKYDPLLQEDYYRLQAFFTPMIPYADSVLVPESRKGAYLVRQEEWFAATHDVRERMEDLVRVARKVEVDRAIERFPEGIQPLLDRESSELSPYERQVVYYAWRQVDHLGGRVERRLKGEGKKKWETLEKELSQFDHLKPEEYPRAMVAADIGSVSPSTPIGGRDARNWSADRGDVLPGVLAVLDQQAVGNNDAATITSIAGRPDSTGRRSALARWLTRPDNQLVTRAMVNRLWQYHFGRGLVATANDFGRQGERPTHPELLDWLARRFVETGWSLKAMHRLILLSNTYRQSSRGGDVELRSERDPDTKWLSRRRSRRLESEGMRDALLAVSGEMDDALGGPAVTEAGQRRSLYIRIRRNEMPPMMDTFDGPDSFTSCARRDVTTTAPQALLLLNGAWTVERATAFAERVARAQDTAESRVQFAYELAFGRSATVEEVDAAVSFFQEQSRLVAQALDDEVATDGESTGETIEERAQSAALVDFCHMLLNSNEFLYVD